VGLGAAVNPTRLGEQRIVPRRQQSRLKGLTWNVLAGRWYPTQGVNVMACVAKERRGGTRGFVRLKTRLNGVVKRRVVLETGNSAPQAIGHVRKMWGM
jgi:hypothetical protein